MYWSKGTGDDGSNTNGNSYIITFVFLVFEY